jgi:hypothetical protein
MTFTQTFSNRARRSVGIMLGLCLLALTQLATAQESVFGARANPAHDVGRIEQVNFDSGTLIIDGLRYWAAHNIQVEIGDSYGALTMLRPGMVVRMHYRTKPGGQRELYRLEEETNPRRHHDT